MKTESESLYGSSIYRDGQIVDDADLPEYAQLCRRLFPTLMSEENDNAGPEAEENLARYMKYLTGLPLPSLKIEPALLQSDIQRISNELTMLLLNEATNPHKNDHLQKNTQKGSQQSFKHQLSRQTGDSDQGSEIGDIYEEGAVPQNASSVNSGGDDEPHIFNVVYETGKAAAAATEKLNANLNEAQKSLSQLEAACGMFSMEMSELDQRAKIIQRVLDKQDIIMRIIELPRVMQMCVAGGYYEEAVEIAEHVRVTGDRLISDIRDGVRILPGSLDEGSVIVTSTAASREQLVNFDFCSTRYWHNYCMLSATAFTRCAYWFLQEIALDPGATAATKCLFCLL
ncbi:hypothetical protein BX070DRAFT_223248 [Coemansia spiralis]|nr:hypothetical protein BX070DRAFT_223248 [Coemansia spiralis]